MRFQVLVSQKQTRKINSCFILAAEIPILKMQLGFTFLYGEVYVYCVRVLGVGVWRGGGVGADYADRTQFQQWQECGCQITYYTYSLPIINTHSSS